MGKTLNIEKAVLYALQIFAFVFCCFRVHFKTGKSVQEQIEKFSIIQNGTEPPRASMIYHIDNFIKREVSSLTRS